MKFVDIFTYQLMVADGTRIGWLQRKQADTVGPAQSSILTIGDTNDIKRQNARRPHTENVNEVLVK